MSTLSAENNSDLEIPTHETSTYETSTHETSTHETSILDVEIPNIHQESVTASSISTKKQSSIYYKYFTLTDKRWHCNYCRHEFAILLFKNKVVK